MASQLHLQQHEDASEGDNVDHVHLYGMKAAHFSIYFTRGARSAPSHLSSSSSRPYPFDHEPPHIPTKRKSINHLPIARPRHSNHDIGHSLSTLRSAQAHQSFLRKGVFKLFKLPPEVRVIIFRSYFIMLSRDSMHSDREHPNLLAAARSKPLLYQELLASYHRYYNFRLWCRNEQDFDENVSLELVRSMRHLTLEYNDEQMPPISDERRLSSFSHRIRGPPIARSRYDVAYRDFRHFITEVWHEPFNTKIHQAMNLRGIVVSVRMRPSSSETGILDLVDLMFTYFPVLEHLAVYTVQEDYDCPSPSLRFEKEELAAKRKLVSMEVYDEGSGGEVTGTGFECHWVGKDGRKRCFVMEKRMQRDWRRITGGK
ncbi:hypothetical protein N431DRAFT_477106 [Stipitochalara longipes BDJ]|nr:hypothetical protein N431DRAFT_477106 [Stipitochalara longipes BDJ]